jgi:hypothetical protein
MAKSEGYTWEFKPRFRRHAFGWKSQPAIARVHEAVSEIRLVARVDANLAASGAVLFLEKVSGALEHVDGSSGAIGSAVSHAVSELAAVIAAAPADPATRAAWLERLFDAHAADQMPYIEQLADHWGELCASKELACEWADRLLGITRMALSPDKNLRGYFHGTTACLSALLAAERYDELIDLVSGDQCWPYKHWAVRALEAQGRWNEAIDYAEACRTPSTAPSIDRVCEAILLSAGRRDEAYARYALGANRTTTYLAWFRALRKKYPQRTPAQILSDLVRYTPGEEGKWFAAAKDAGLLDEALALAARAPCDPKTLTRAARDFAAKNPPFAVEAGMAALHWLVQGYGYEITSVDVWAAYSRTLEAAARIGQQEATRDRIRALVAGEQQSGRFVTKILGASLGLSS